MDAVQIMARIDALMMSPDDGLARDLSRYKETLEGIQRDWSKYCYEQMDVYQEALRRINAGKIE